MIVKVKQNKTIHHNP